MNIEDLKGQIKDKTGKAINEIKNISSATKREAKETYLASEILLKLSKGEDVSPEQIRFLKQQSVDFAKALTLIGLQAIPGSSIAIVALEKVAKKYGFTLFPQAQKEPKA